MSRVHKITGYLWDANDTYGELNGGAFESWFKGSCYVGRFEFFSPVFTVESVEIPDEELYDDDGCSDFGDIEDYRKLFKE